MHVSTLARTDGRTEVHNGRPRAKATDHKSDLQELELAPALVM